MGAVARTWELATGQTTAILMGHSEKVNAVAWSPDGTRLATASDDRTVRIWDPNTGRSATTLTGHANWVDTAVWSPDGTRLATAGHDRKVRIWDTNTARATMLIGHTDWVNAVAWSPDGSQLATARGDGIVTLWTREGDESTSVNIQTAISLAWSKDTIAVAHPKSPAIIKILEEPYAKHQKLTDSPL